MIEAQPQLGRPSGAARAVLVVEDDPVLLDCLAATLEDEGYRVLRARHGREALGLLAGGERPGLILLDMNMPVMDGWRFADEYRRLPGPHAPILVATAAHDPRDRLAEIGALDVLAKPFDLDVLVAAVERCMAAPA